MGILFICQWNVSSVLQDALFLCFYVHASVAGRPSWFCKWTSNLDLQRFCSRVWFFPICVCLHLWMHAWAWQRDRSTEVRLKLGSHETFIMWGPEVINELSTTSVNYMVRQYKFSGTTSGLDTTTVWFNATTCHICPAKYAKLGLHDTGKNDAAVFFLPAIYGDVIIYRKRWLSSIWRELT